MTKSTGSFKEVDVHNNTRQKGSLQDGHSEQSGNLTHHSSDALPQHHVAQSNNGRPIQNGGSLNGRDNFAGDITSNGNPEAAKNDIHTNPIISNNPAIYPNNNNIATSENPPNFTDPTPRQNNRTFFTSPQKIPLEGESSSNIHSQTRQFFERDGGIIEDQSSQNAQNQPSGTQSELNTLQNSFEQEKKPQPQHESLENEPTKDESTPDTATARMDQQHQHHHRRHQNQHQQRKQEQRRMRKKCTTTTAIIAEDASTAFSPYRPIPELSHVQIDVCDKLAICTKEKGKKEKKRDKKLKNASDGRHKNGERKKKSKRRKQPPELEETFEDGNVSFSSYEHIGSIDMRDAPHDDHSTQPSINDATNPTSNDPLDLILSTDDPLLQNYLPQMTMLNDQFYAKIKPFRMGNRNLPSNQLEVVLRRRAIKKRETGKAISGVDVSPNSATSAGATTASSVITTKTTQIPSTNGNLRRPPSRGSQQPPSNNARRTLFPSAQHSPPTSHRKSIHDDDDSTISSTTAASTWTASSVARSTPSLPPLSQSKTQHALPPLHPTHAAQSLNNAIMATATSTSTATATALLPKEEVVGDTSLGLKLTILQGKVIIQKITALDDGRASPAQLCGLITPGDIVIAVDGKTLINGSIQNPVPMDQMFKVLQPLSQPLHEGGKFYAREVRLRFLLGEGKGLLREQEEREKKRQREIEIRKKMGLDGVRMDPAGDIFSIASFMAVDQHSGMPLFGHNWGDHHKKEEGKQEVDDSIDSLGKGDHHALIIKDTRGAMIHCGEAMQKVMPWFNRVPPAVQAQIARQIAVETQYIRDRHTSGFFALDNNAPLLLRSASPPPKEPDSHASNPIDARKRRLELGSEIMNHAKSLVAIVETQDRGLDNVYPDEDPMEVASRVCGTASIRTGASRRRWHRGDSVVTTQSSVASSTENNQVDVSTIRSGESLEACDHQLLVGLAANNEPWKKQVVKRLEVYVEDTEKENMGDMRCGMNSHLSEEEEVMPTSLDSLLFGDVSSILGKKKQSLALPPGEMTSMLYDLVEHLDSDLPDQIFMKDDSSAFPLSSPEKAFTSLSTPAKPNNDVQKAKEFLINDALGVWLKTFRPLPWEQRRALWPVHQSGMNAELSMVSSRLDDSMSLSMASGSTVPKTSAHKRNLREVIEDMELDHETRRETCSLVTFYFTQKYSLERQNFNNAGNNTLSMLSQDDEKAAVEVVDAYGSYLDINECLITAGKIRSKMLVDKLVDVAKYDAHHTEALKAIRKAKVLLFYEPHMLSAIIELLPSISGQCISNNFDFMSLLVSAYPDLSPWCVRESTKNNSQFYFKYLSSLMHHEDGNDSAKRDKLLVKEWCLMLSSSDTTDMDAATESIDDFFHIASKSDENSIFYHRDLPFLMEISMRMSQFGLALDLANEIITNPIYRRDKQSLLDVVNHLRTISDAAIKGNDGELNSALLSQVISFLNVISPCMTEHRYEFSITDELTNLLDQSVLENANDDGFNESENVDTCIVTISENAPPDEYLKVLAEWEHTSVESPAIISAIHTCMIRGARKGVNKEISGSLLRIQRAREEGRRPFVDNAINDWTSSVEITDDEEENGFLWPNILNGTLVISK